MLVRTGLHNRRAGFSLVELLLTMVLILCLAAASVFCYTAVHRQASLDEGADRLQSILRFARAEAATTGRKVRLQFVNAATEGERSDLKAIRVEWEPDFLTSPGVFQTYTNKAWSEDLVNELVAVQEVKPLSPQPTPPASVASVSAESSLDQFPGEAEYGEDFEVEEVPAITFYPDGSSDSAQIIIASRNEEDPRRIAVTVTGMLGAVSSKVVSEEDEYDPWFDEEVWIDEESDESPQPLTFPPDTGALGNESFIQEPASNQFAGLSRF